MNFNLCSKNNVHRSSCVNDSYFSHQAPFFGVFPHTLNDVLQVLNMFFKGFPNSITFLSHMVCPKFSPSHQYRWAEGEALNHHIEISILGASKVSENVLFYPFVMGQSKWHITKVPIIVAFLHYCALFLILGLKTLDCTLVFPILAHHHFKVFLGENFHQNVKNKNKEGISKYSYFSEAKC